MNEVPNLINSFFEGNKSLWHFSLKGQSLEVITPIITVGDVFITVFVTKRADYYVITDGGWIDKGFYNENIKNTGGCTQIARNLASFHNIEETSGKGVIYFYIKIRDIENIPLSVLNFASFIAETVGNTVLN